MMYLFANLLLCVAAVSVQTMARRERTTRLTALHKIHFRIPIRIPFARPDINRQSAPMAISVAASCAPAIAMTTATPKPWSLPVALPTPRHAHIFVSKRCAQSVKHPNLSVLAISYAVFSSTGCSLSADIQIGFAAPPRRASRSGHRGSATVTGRFRGWKLVCSASHSKRFFQVLTSPALFARTQCANGMPL